MPPRAHNNMIWNNIDYVFFYYFLILFIFIFSIENVCGHPPVPVNARLVRDGAKATFVCDDGYKLFG